MASTKLTLILVTTRISHFLLHSQVFNPSNKFLKLSLHISLQLWIPCYQSLTTQPTFNLDIAEENLSNPWFRQRNLNLTTLPHSPTPPIDEHQKQKYEIFISTYILISLSNHKPGHVIPASSEVITYHSLKTKVPKQTKLYPPLDLNINVITGGIKVFSPWIWFHFSCLEPYSYSLYTKLRYYGFIPVLYICPKSLGTTWWYFTVLKLCKCSWMIHPLPSEASTSNRTKTNHHWLYHLQALHKH